MIETLAAGCLFVAMLVSMDIGYRIGHRRKASDPQTSIEVIGTVVKRLYIWDGVGGEWDVSRRDLRNIVADANKYARKAS